MLSIIRKVFKDYYVSKENRKDSWKYTIYCGDKETMEFLHKPIKFETPKQEFNRLFKDEMKKLREYINK